MIPSHQPANFATVGKFDFFIKAAQCSTYSGLKHLLFGL